MTATRLEKQKAIYEGWRTLAEGLDAVMALMESMGDDPNILATRLDHGCAGILRFRSQMRNYAGYYRIEYLHAIEEVLLPAGGVSKE